MHFQGTTSGLNFYTVDTVVVSIFLLKIIAIDYQRVRKTLLIFNRLKNASWVKINPRELLKESLRVTKNGGTILYSSYSEKFWNHRLEWFQIQSAYKLIGEIDYDKTKNGIIVCKDGFIAITYSGEEFLKLASNFNIQAEFHEIDNLIVFCRMKKSPVHSKN